MTPPWPDLDPHGVRQYHQAIHANRQQCITPDWFVPALERGDREIVPWAPVFGCPVHPAYSRDKAPPRREQSLSTWRISSADGAGLTTPDRPLFGGVNGGVDATGSFRNSAEISPT